MLRSGRQAHIYEHVACARHRAAMMPQSAGSLLQGVRKCSWVHGRVRDEIENPAITIEGHRSVLLWSSPW